MNNITQQVWPAAYRTIAEETARLGFTMPSEIQTCALLRTLAAAKPRGSFLELGTGSGLATAWILDGMDTHSTLISFDHDERLLNIARNNLGNDSRLTLELADGGDWVASNATKS